MKNSPKMLINIPTEVEPYREDIRRFVDAMIYKLKVHSKKGRWEGLTTEKVLTMLRGEVEELREAIVDGNMVEILTEAADVANYALIVASITIERGVATNEPVYVKTSDYDPMEYDVKRDPKYNYGPNIQRT